MSVLPLEITEMCTGHNGDKSEMATTKTATRQNGDTKTATTRVKTATTISQNGDKHWSKRRQALVKTATNFGQNGDSHLVKTATVVSQRRRNLVGQNGDNSQSKLGLERIHQVTNAIRIFANTLFHRC